MESEVNEVISVISIFDTATNKFYPTRIKWKNETYIVTKIGFHHKQKIGETLHHRFSILSKDLFMLVDLNSTSLRWTLLSVDNS